MSIHNVIVLTAAPVGRFLEGYLSGTALPGQRLQVKAGVPMNGGRLTYEVFNGVADGEAGRTPIILMENWFLGKGKEDQLNDGERIQMYCPIPGDELQVRVSSPGTGTGDAIAIGDKLMADDGTGNYVLSTGTPEAEEFEAQEALTDVVVAGTLVHSMYTGK